MASSKHIGSLFTALLILDLAFAARSSSHSHRQLQSSNADGSSTSGTGFSSSWSSSVSGSGYEGGVDDRRWKYGGRSCGGAGGGGGGEGENGGGGGEYSDFKVVTRGSETGLVEGGGKGGSTPIHGKQANKGGLE